jgi:hypothetical protein
MRVSLFKTLAPAGPRGDGVEMWQMAAGRHRRRWTAALATVTAVTAAPIAWGADDSTPPVGTWRNDHVLLAVTGGPDGAQGFSTSFTVELADLGTGPRAALLAGGDSRIGSIGGASEGGGGPIRLSTTSAAGGVSVQMTGSLSTVQPQPVTLSLTIDALQPGETVVVVEAFANMRVSPAQTPAYQLAGGSVALDLEQGAGTVAVPVGDPTDRGVAADAGPTGAGVQEHDFTAPSGIVGAFLHGITQASAGTWAAPDGNTGSYANVGSQWVGWPSFAGPQGGWQVDWAGSDTTPFGNPVAFVYAPVGTYWPLFRCSGTCFSPLPGSGPVAPS